MLLWAVKRSEPMRECAVDLSRDVAFEAAHDLLCPQALRAATKDVVPGPGLTRLVEHDCHCGGWEPQSMMLKAISGGRLDVDQADPCPLAAIDVAAAAGCPRCSCRNPRVTSSGPESRTA